MLDKAGKFIDGLSGMPDNGLAGAVRDRREGSPFVGDEAGVVGSSLGGAARIRGAAENQTSQGKTKKQKANEDLGHKSRSSCSFNLTLDPFSATNVCVTRENRLYPRLKYFARTLVREKSVRQST